MDGVRCHWCGIEVEISKADYIELFKEHYCRNKSECNEIYQSVTNTCTGTFDALNNIITTELISKYLSGKNSDFKIAFHLAVKSLDSNDLRYPLYVSDEEIEELDEEYPDSLWNQLYRSLINLPSVLEEDNNKLYLQGLSQNLKNLSEINLLHKLLKKKGVKITKESFALAISEYVLTELKEISKDVVEAAFNKISLLTSSDKKIIAKEFLKINTENNIFYLQRLFDKFMLPYTFTEVVNLISEANSFLELETFESKLGIQKNSRIDTTYDHLDGYEFEDYVKQLFQLLGYQVVPTKLSNDQGADLILLKGNIKTVVQCKRYSSSVSNKAIQEVVAAKNHYNGDQALVVCTSDYTKSARELAKSNNVHIWDRDKLEETISYVNK